MKVLCCGSRHWDLRTPVEAALSDLKDYDGGDDRDLFFKSLDVTHIEIVHGNALGADSLCDYYARKLGYVVHRHRADWKKHGKAAGPIRNQEMLDKHPDICLVLAFSWNLSESKGTADMVRRATKKGIPVKVISG
jgi:hypothetical protein